MEHTTSGNSFIDENHAGLLNNISAIAESVRDGWDMHQFSSRVDIFITDLENHFSHEEVILKAIGFKDLNVHSIKHRQLSMRLRISSMKITDRQDSLEFLANLKTSIFAHELFVDQEYWHHFEAEVEEPWIQWGENLESGDHDTDKHHIALINHINRLCSTIFIGEDYLRAYDELMLLCEYSRYHFGKEELSLGKNLRSGHRENHQKILMDLESVAMEVRDGRYKLQNLRDYLKYWIVNHIQSFDVPAFKTNN